MSLAWSAPPECPDEAFVRGEVDRLLAEGPPPTARIEAQAVVSRTAEGRWRVHIAIVRDGVAGDRTIEAGSCRPLADATALIVVLAIDPTRAGIRAVDAAAGLEGALSGPLGPPPSSGSSAAATPKSATAMAPGRPLVASSPSLAIPAARAGGPSIHADVFVAIGADIGSLPAPAIGAALNGAVLLGRLRLEAYGEHWFARSRTVLTPSAAYGGTIDLWAGGAAGCFVAAHARFELGPCLAVEVGELHGAGTQVDMPTQTNGWWVAVVGALHGTMRLSGPLWVGMRVEGIVPLIRDRFVVNINDQTSLVFRSAPVAGRAFLGPELRF